MRFRQLKLRLQTSDGPYGATIGFPDGLVIVWADNSMGKSTCVKSILVALGLEAMLTTSQADLPLPPAMTSELEFDGQRHEVIESEVFLEIQNSNGDLITVQRTLKGIRDHHLITVHDGGILSQQGITVPSRDYFVGRSGGASRDAGFHHFLSKFLSWDLPIVPTHDGNEAPLYLQCIFPFFVVEQTRGWSTIQPPLPTHFRIRDVQKRAIEFILKLDAHKIALRRQELQSHRANLEADWSAKGQQLAALAESIGGMTQGVPQRPLVKWPPEALPFLAVADGDQWISLEQRIAKEEASYGELIQQEIPRVQEIASAAEAELAEAERAVRDREALLSRLLNAFELEQQEVASVELRLTTLDEDIQRNKDDRTLRAMGSMQSTSVKQGICPVCHQTIQDSLVPLAAEQAVMSLDENIAFLTEQRRTFTALLSNAKRVVQARERRVKASRTELSTLRDEVRHLRQTLVSDARLPSVAAIQNRIKLENSIQHDREIAEQFNQNVTGFADLSASWAAVNKELKDLPADDVTVDDKSKLSEWSKLLRDQLEKYGFKSLPLDQLVISTDTYRPEHQGFDLQTSISASDLIRTIWAYLHGMLELSRTNSTNHPGTVIFDEPRQQSTRDVSFAELLKRASAASEYNQQVIFFTSENRERLKSHLSGIPHQLRPIEGRVLQKRQ